MVTDFKFLLARYKFSPVPCLRNLTTIAGGAEIPFSIHLLSDGNSMTC